MRCLLCSAEFVLVVPPFAFTLFFFNDMATTEIYPLSLHDALPISPESGAVLYETTENLSMRALQGGRRRAISELLGTAARGSALCPEALVKVLVPPVPYCVLNSTGSEIGRAHV